MRKILESIGFAMALAACAGCYQGVVSRKDPVRIDVSAGECLLSVRDKVRDIPVADRAKGVEIVLADGEYFLPQVLGLGGADSGDARSPVVWKAKNPGRAVLRADIRVPSESFRLVNDASVLARLPENARGRVFVADLSKIVPGTLPALKDSFEGAPPPPVVLVNGRFGTLARWPNAPKSVRPKPDAGFAAFKQAVDKGMKSKWTDDGRHYYEGGAFVFDDPRARRWHFDEGVWMSGYWSFDWNVASVRAVSYGTENGTNNVLRMVGGKPYPYGVLNYRTGQYGRLQKTYSGGIKAYGVGLAIRGNEICDAPHTAIFYETNDSVIETNDIHHVMLEAEDAGAIYTGRDLTTQGNVIRGNFIHECADWTTLDGDSTMGIYFDDRDCGDAVYDNVFYRLSIGVFVNGGRDHPIERNLFCECRRAIGISFSGMRQAQRRKAGERDPLIVKAEKLGFRDEPWKSRYPRLAAIESQEPNLPLGNDIIGNVFIDSDDDILRIGDLGVEQAVSNEVKKPVVCDNVIGSTGPKFKTMPDRDALRNGFRAARSGEVEKWLSRTRISR